MQKLKAELSHEYQLKDGGYVYYYDIGHWCMELIESRSYKREIEDAKHAIKVHKAWVKKLKKLDKKNPRH